ncbi:hypothetical protein L7F22_065826 [Adiantum nelumboides]|nr:hypothetical protein [Adiantum nelumboides]
MKEQVTLDGSTSNNEAEYDVLISGLKICLAQKIQRLMLKGDALLIVKQVLGKWACKNERLRTKVTSIRKHFNQFEEVQLYHIPRKENEDAHLLAHQAFSNQDRAHVVIEAIALKGPQYTGKQEQNNDEAWIDKLLSLVDFEWKREAAYHCYERKALQLKDKLNEGLKHKEIKEESLVLRYNNALDNKFDAKFERSWEGPFIVKKAFIGGYYQLMDLNGKEHPRKVNGYPLKPYLSRILPTVFETKQVSNKTNKFACETGVASGGRHPATSPCFPIVWWCSTDIFLSSSEATPGSWELRRRPCVFCARCGGSVTADLVGVVASIFDVVSEDYVDFCWWFLWWKMYAGGSVSGYKMLVDLLASVQVLLFRDVDARFRLGAHG